MRRVRGFTLVEMTVTVAVLVMFTALVTPNIVGMKLARERRAAYDKVYQMALHARESAILEGRPYELVFDDGQGTLRIEREPTDTLDVNGNLENTVSDPAQPETEDVESFSLPEGMRADGFRLADNTVGSADWRLRFYPDGKSDGGGLEIVEGNYARSLQVTKDGIPHLIDGPLPDTSQDKWQAGDFVLRQ